MRTALCSTAHEKHMKIAAGGLESRAMRTATTLALALAAVALGAASDTVWTFDGDVAGRTPPGFAFRVARDAAPARWAVQRDASNGFLAHAGDPAARGAFSLALVESPIAGVASVSARARLAGAHGAVGIVWRVQDADNYYLARLDLDGKEQDIGLYRIVNGNRVRVDGEDDLELDRAAWHTLKAVQEGDQIRVYLGGIRVLRARDRTFTRPGTIGVWCTGDAVAHFDDVRAGTGRDAREDAGARADRGR